jgi:HSP20 family molecular chaperone IbpA
MAQLTKQPHETSVHERTREGALFTPRFDIFENADELLLFGDLPGVTKDGLDIRFERGELTIYGKVAPRPGDVEFVYGEYGVGDFYRVFAIGEAIDSSRIFAELKNGVLTVHLPKSEAVKPRRIEIKSE